MEKDIKLFEEYYREQKKNLTKIIDDYNEELVKEDNKIVKENLEYFKELNSNGKLIRGILVNLGYSLVKDNLDYSNYLALAYELFQTSILIHDDIIDNDNKRRGKDTVHYANYKKYSIYNDNKDEIKHLSNSIALCVGDYGLYLSNKVVIDKYQNDSNLAKVLSNFNDTVLKTIKGEILDVVLPTISKDIGISEADLEETINNIYLLKTAHYTIIGPLSSGLILGSATSKKIDDITKFGEKVGVAFQIQDDILGIFSNEMGKVKGSDIREFKQTILYSLVAKSDYKEELLKYYGKNKLTAKDISKVQEIFIKSEAKRQAEEVMNNLYDDSIKDINNIKWISEDKKSLLRGFVYYLKNRNK